MEKNTCIIKNLRTGVQVSTDQGGIADKLNQFSSEKITTAGTYQIH
jgi:hypothetical protein